MIAKEGWIFIAIGLALTLLFIWIATRFDSKAAFLSCLLFGLLTLFTTFFFRDPDRSINTQLLGVVSPADGKVVAVKSLASHPFMGENAIQVSIFLSIFDVHINRVPSDGKIEYVNYNEGEFLPAYNDKASIANEQTEIGMVTDFGQRLIFKQIAGIIARRIVCNLKSGELVKAGERFGLIRFGSRVDIIFPEGSRIEVHVGDYVKGGESLIGFLSELPAIPDSINRDVRGADAGL